MEGRFIRNICSKQVLQVNFILTNTSVIFLVTEDMANSIVKFDEHGDGLARYTIYNYQKKTTGTGYDYKVTFLFSYESFCFDIYLM